MIDFPKKYVIVFGLKVKIVASFLYYVIHINWCILKLINGSNILTTKNQGFMGNSQCKDCCD